MFEIRSKGNRFFFIFLVMMQKYFNVGQKLQVNVGIKDLFLFKAYRHVLITCHAMPERESIPQKL